jgi:hypothetical protein
MSTCLQKQNRYDVGTTKKKTQTPPARKRILAKNEFLSASVFLRNTLLQIKRIISLERKSATADNEDD